MAILRSTVLGGDDSPLAVTVNLDPTTNVVDAPAGSLIIFGALWYRKKVSGSNTDVVPVAASDLPGWGRENLADSLTADPLDLWGLAAFVGQRWVAKRAGSITGLSARLSTPVTAGSITVEAYKNNVATGFTVVLDTTAGTNQKNFSSQAQEASAASTFVAKDDLDLRVTTTATFTPTGTAELAAFLEIST